MKLLAAARRPGITLLEVLTAIFIMGIGMLALLTLFPLGALSMARAVRDDRAATIAANAAAVAAMFDLRNDTNLEAAFTAYAPTDANAPSNPVFVDPQVSGLPGARPLGEYPAGAGTTSPGIRRTGPTWATTNQTIARWFTLQDELEFDTLGGAKGWPTSVNRPGTYSLAYLVRRPRKDARDFTELTVVVYAQRATDSFLAEPVYYNGAPTLLGTSGTNTLSVPYTPPNKPDIRKGMWLLDTTADLPKQIVNGHVYKVESVTERVQGGNQFLDLELDRVLKANVSTIVVLQSAIAVIERGTTWLP